MITRRRMKTVNLEKAKKKVVFDGKLPDRYFLTSDDLAELFTIAQTDLWDALCKAFYAGVIAGNHATVTHDLKKM